MHSNLVIRFLKSPFGLFVGLVSGVLTGQFLPDFATIIAPFVQVVTNLLEMCIMPILFTSVSLSIANLLTIKAKLDLRKSITSFLFIFLLASSVGLIMAFLARPGYTLDTEASAKLRQVAIESAELARSLDEPIERQSDSGFIRFLQTAVPSNIFEATAADKFLQVLTFSILFGVTMAFIQAKNRSNVTSVLNGVRETFEKIYDTVLIMMPIVIFLIMANAFGEVGVDTFVGMLPFILSLYVSFFIMFVIGMVMISYKLKITPIKAVGMVQEPIIIALVTHSPIAAMPSAIKALTENYKLDQNIVNMLTSVGLVLGEFGITLYFSFACIFVAQYYDHSLAADPLQNLDSIVLILLMSIVAALATIGSPNKLSLGGMSIVLDLLGLPLSAFLVLFLLIDYIIDPFRSAIMLQGNLTAIVFIAGKPIQAAGFTHHPPDPTVQTKNV